jgi:hypothetical protein
MSFIYAGCIGVVVLTVLGILGAMEAFLNEMRDRFH